MPAFSLFSMRLFKLIVCIPSAAPRTPAVIPAPPAHAVRRIFREVAAGACACQSLRRPAMGNKPSDTSLGGLGGVSPPGEAKLRVHIMTENLAALEKFVRESPACLQKRFSPSSPGAGLTPLEFAALQGLKAVRAPPSPACKLISRFFCVPAFACLSACSCCVYCHFFACCMCICCWKRWPVPVISFQLERDFGTASLLLTVRPAIAFEARCCP